MALTEAEVIPILDMGPWLAGEPGSLEVLGEELRAALLDVGFFFVVNHGIPWNLVQAIYAQAALVHDLPQKDKDAMAMGRDWGGYLGLGGGTSYASDIAGEVRKPNLNEAFFIHRGGYRQGNRFPEMADFKTLTSEYMDRMETLATSVLSVLATSLRLSPNWFDPYFEAPSTTLRMSHYPVLDYEVDDWGIAAHTDASIFTFLPSNDVAGLEIRPEGQPWIVPPSIPESFLVNSGDMLRRWTNDSYLSTAHRARNGSDRDRYAIPFFYGARDDAVVEAVPTTVSDQQPALHDPITYGDYQRWFINRNYAQVTGEQADPTPP